MILNIYKPRTWTSFDVVAKVRGILKEKKVGHAGTLDPLAEGLLLVLTGNDCKQQDSLMRGTKEYYAEISFGIDSPTFDLEFIPTVTSDLSSVELSGFSQKITSLLSLFLGESDQTVPIYSAKKVKGKALYKVARQNGTSLIDLNDLPKNHINIYNLTIKDPFLKSIETDKGILNIPTIGIVIECSHGTYIRSLAHDLGIKADTTAILTKLVRTRVGDFKVEDSVQLTDLANSVNLKS